MKVELNRRELSWLKDGLTYLEAFFERQERTEIPLFKGECRKHLKEIGVLKQKIWNWWETDVTEESNSLKEVGK